MVDFSLLHFCEKITNNNHIVFWKRWNKEEKSLEICLVSTCLEMKQLIKVESFPLCEKISTKEEDKCDL